MTHTGKMGYSQYGEDQIVAHLLQEMKCGWLLEIGAWDPIEFSNSRLLIEAGWHAVLVEFSPGPLKRLAQEYNDCGHVDIIAAAVAIGDGKLVKCALTDDAVSTSSAATEKIWSEAGGYYGRAYVPTIKIEDILAQFGGFQFVSIDAEGYSVDLAKTYLGTGQLPDAMIVEHDNRLGELLSIATARGYSAVHVNGTNVVLSRR